MSGAQEAASPGATALDAETSGVARFVAHLGIGVAGLLLGAIAGAILALAFGLVQLHC